MAGPTTNLSLSLNFIEAMRRTYGGTRLARQELDGELIEDVEGSLWPRALIEKCRGDAPAVIDRIVIGVDPPVGVGPDCDACGIVVAAKAGDQYYVLADESVQGLSPDGWARAAAEAAEKWDADRIVAEANNGGEMVRSCLIAAGASVRPKLVHASRGKVAAGRAGGDPVRGREGMVCGDIPGARGRAGGDVHRRTL